MLESAEIVSENNTPDEELQNTGSWDFHYEVLNGFDDNMMGNPKMDVDFSRLGLILQALFPIFYKSKDRGKQVQVGYFTPSEE